MSGDLPPPDPSNRNNYAAEPKPPPRSGEYERLRRVLIPIAGVAMVMFAIGLGAFVLRDRNDGSRVQGVFGTSPTTTATPAGTASATTALATPAATEATTPPSTAATTAAPPTTAPTATSTATVATSAPTTAAPVTGTSTTSPDTSTSAVATAQALLDALADGRWNDARVLNPGRNETDAFLQSQYGPLEQATIVPAKITPVSAGRFDLRFGIVAHEAQPTGQQTVLMCSHWQVDVATKTVQRISSVRLRVEGGYVQPGPVTAELSSTCQSVPAT
jgi:hypothetical protein